MKAICKEVQLNSVCYIFKSVRFFYIHFKGLTNDWCVKNGKRNHT